MKMKNQFNDSSIFFAIISAIRTGTAFPICLNALVREDSK